MNERDFDKGFKSGFQFGKEVANEEWLNKVRQAKEEIEEYVHCDKYDCINEDMTNWICASEVVAILDKLIEGEEKINEEV